MNCRGEHQWSPTNACMLCPARRCVAIATGRYWRRNQQCRGVASEGGDLCGVHTAMKEKKERPRVLQMYK